MDGKQQTKQSRREARAHRILDAAEALILRWGYNKTSIEDIARQAGVAKGTIYLHWKTREALFVALVKREKVKWAEDFLKRINGDLESATLRGMLKHSALALLQRPLLKAILLRDAGVLGKLAHGELSAASNLERLLGFQAYLEFLQKTHLARSDLSLRAQTYIVSAVFMGFFLIAAWVPDEVAVSEAQLAELLAETAHRTLEPDRPISKEELESVFPAFLAYLRRDVEIMQARFAEELMPRPDTLIEEE